MSITSLINIPLLPALCGGTIGFAAAKQSRRSGGVAPLTPVIGEDRVMAASFAVFLFIGLILGLLAYAIARPHSPYGVAILWGLSSFAVIVGLFVLGVFALLSLWGPQAIMPTMMRVNQHIKLIFGMLMAGVSFVITFLYANRLQLPMPVSLLTSVIPILLLVLLQSWKSKAWRTGLMLIFSTICFLVTFNMDPLATGASAYLLAMYCMATLDSWHDQLDVGRVIFIMPVVCYLPVMRYLI